MDIKSTLLVSKASDKIVTFYINYGLGDFDIQEFSSIKDAVMYASSSLDDYKVLNHGEEIEWSILPDGSTYYVDSERHTVICA